MYLETKQLLFEQETNNFSPILNDCLADIIICDEALLLAFLPHRIIDLSVLLLRNFHVYTRLMFRTQVF